MINICYFDPFTNVDYYLEIGTSARDLNAYQKIPVIGLGDFRTINPSNELNITKMELILPDGSSKVYIIDEFLTIIQFITNINEMLMSNIVYVVHSWSDVYPNLIHVMENVYYGFKNSPIDYQHFINISI